ncbi:MULTISPECIES: hypothetical protein [Tsukamurella]|uniref:PH domain-containing protein n=2 Tax=Tsukamurella TaxID=2060 RepID=A0A5C5S2N9_9ACTN|nr:MULTISPECIES: hypothetical protein [Tsukamurella]NMD54659.1 hypothetical protein [Tsukamurella columbiensis]TWS28571.1 hypothetical protein FK530_13255 [Tsukamurella conjunctivitidis]
MLLLHFVVAPIFGVIGLAMIVSPESEWRSLVPIPVVGLVAVLLGAGSLVFGIVALTVRRTVLVVDSRGIRSPRGGFDFDWQGADAVHVGCYRGGRFGPTLYVLGVAGRPIRTGRRLPLSGFNAALMGLPPEARAHRVTWQIGTRPSFDEAIRAVRVASPETPIAP